MDETKPEIKGTRDSRKKYIFIGIILALIVTGIFYMKMTGNAIRSGKQVLLKTNMGDITLQLYDDMPITTQNFLNLVEKGTYNGVIFHRIIDGFMIQGGDPTGTGYGDRSIPNIKDEFTHKPSNNNREAQ